MLRIQKVKDRMAELDMKPSTLAFRIGMGTHELNRQLEMPRRFIKLVWVARIKDELGFDTVDELIDEKEVW